MLRTIFGAALAMIWACILAGPAMAQEVVNYSYDALGRLIESKAITGPKANSDTQIAYDAADNRTSYTVTGGVTQPTFSISSASTNEGSPLTFTVTLAGASGSTSTVNYATTSGTAVAGTNYTAASGTLTFPAGATTATVSVSTIHDSIYTANLGLTVTLSSPSTGTVIGTGSASGTIVNTDAQPTATLSIAAASANEGSPLSFVVTRSGYTSSTVTVSYATANGTAVAGTNYSAASGTLSIASGVTAQSITVPTIDDHAMTGNLLMAVNLTAPSSGAMVSTGSAYGTIVNIDMAWSSVLTAGSSTTCVDLGMYGSFCIPFVGYDSTGVGAMSNVAYAGNTITSIGTVYGTYLTVSITGATVPANAGWTSITLPGAGTFQRTAAAYAISGNVASWSWTLTSGALTSGTVTIR